MFQTKRSTLVASIVAIILTLMTAAVGLALWNETLIVEGQVDTGNVDVEVLFESAIDNEETYDVAKCSATTGDLSGDEVSRGGGGPNNRLSIAVKNGYPGYDCRVRFGVYNNGSIPLLIKQPNFTKLPPDDALTVSFEDCYDNDTFLTRDETVSCTIRVSVEQGAEQGQAYWFETNVEARQFNEP
ncbi:MAG: hypothetical protein GTO14_07965 [Anaerolineales bacterium]|nr:hypothetical protein [Anaerolineales bacterium]